MSSDLAVQVYEVVSQIPSGKVMTYSQIGKVLGVRCYRYIGQILHQNPDSSTIPCHRVVFASGQLAPGFAFGGPNRQKELLEKEGVEIEGNKVKLDRFLLTDF